MNRLKLSKLSEFLTELAISSLPMGVHVAGTYRAYPRWVGQAELA